MLDVWFLFEKQDNEYLLKIICELGSKFAAPLFVPHITAYGMVDIDFETLDNIVQNSIKGEKSFIVQKEKLSYSEHLWKTLFIDIIPNEPLLNINQKLSRSLNSFTEFEFYPHTSLIYKKITTKDKQMLSESLQIKNNFKISGLCIHEFFEDIQKWRILRKYNLEIG